MEKLHDLKFFAKPPKGKMKGLLIVFAWIILWNFIYQDVYKRQLQIPANQYRVVRLGTKKIVDYAHRYNIAVQYWTINDPEEVRLFLMYRIKCFPLIPLITTLYYLSLIHI